MNKNIPCLFNDDTVFDVGQKVKCDVSVVLVNYNSSKYTIDCIKSIREYTNSKIDYEIIVVDNGSKTEDYNLLKNGLKEMEQHKLFLIRNHLNTGFAQGNMTGANFATGRYLYLLNNDCIFKNDVMEKLMEFMESNTNVACCVPKMFNKEGMRTPSFQYFPSIASKWFGNTFLSKMNKQRYPDRRAEFREPLEIQVASGASLFIDSVVFYEMGGLDTNLFLYLEEEDLCIRLKKSGYRSFYVPSAEITHLGGESTAKNLCIAKEYYISLWHYLSKHCSPSQRFLIKLRYFLRELGGVFKNHDRWKILKFILRGAPMSESLRYRQKNDL